MPRRLRVSKRRDHLTAMRALTLTIGPRPRRPGEPHPEPGDAEMELLEACWFQHRELLIGDGDPADCWGWWTFERGIATWPELEAV